MVITLFNRGDRRLLMAFLTTLTTKNPAPRAIIIVKIKTPRKEDSRLPKNEITPVIAKAIR
jgi:hypothetical protein